jgi:uncharacterized protein (DUF1697 family)
MARKNEVSQYVAFLRGINVGGHRLSMDRLRDLFAELGFSNVATFIASGNVIFDAPSADVAGMEKRIEAHLGRSLGYQAETFIRTPAELASIVAFQPFAPEDVEAPGHTLHVAFLREALGKADAKKMLSFRTEMDDFRVRGRELYWLCRGKTTESLVPWPQVAKQVPMRATMRNVKTVRKIAAKYPPA